MQVQVRDAVSLRAQTAVRRTLRYVLRRCYTAEWLEAGWLMRVTWVRFWVGGFLLALPVCVMGRVVGEWAWVLGLLCGGWRGILVQCIDALLCAFGRMYV